MSLMQLLAVGSSIRTIKDEPSRYKMTQQHLLPKFGRAARPEKKMPDAVQAQSRPVVEEQRAPASQPEPQGKKNEMNALLTKPHAQSRAASETVLTSAFPLGRWTRLRKNPFGPRPRQEVVTAPVQGELRLDLVKPVRNDLSDADLEVVEAAEPAPAAQESAPGLSIGESHRFLWSRLTARIFRAGSC
jgi:hypothetical protein